MNDFVQLREETNVFQTETTIEGTLDDFDFGEGAEDERPGKSTGQEAGPADGAGAEEGATGTKRKKAAAKGGDAKPKTKASVAPKKRAVKVRLCDKRLATKKDTLRKARQLPIGSPRKVTCWCRDCNGS